MVPGVEAPQILHAPMRMSSQCAAMTAEDMSARIARAVQHAPEWLRQAMLADRRQIVSLIGSSKADVLRDALFKARRQSKWPEDKPARVSCADRSRYPH